MRTGMRLGLLVLLVSLLIGPPAPVAAQGPAGEWVSGIACQNLGDSDAMITIEFFPEGSGTSVLTYADPDPIPPGGSRNYYTPSSPPGLPSDFLGSAVVNSDQPISCNVNTQTDAAGTSSDPYRIGTSAGFLDNQTSATIFVPQVEKNFAGGWSSYVAVQNTGDASVEVTVTYKDRYGADIPAATEGATIPAKSNKVFYQAANPDLPDDFLGSATITADSSIKLAVTVNFYNSGVDYSSAQLHSYNGVGSGANKLLVPRFVRNYYGYNSGLAIQNIGGSATSVEITFHFAGNQYTYTSGTIGPGAALFLYAPNIAELDPVDSLTTSLRAGSAEIVAQSGGTIIAIVNEDNRGGPEVPTERIGQGATYNAMPDGSQTTNLFFFQVPRRAGGIFSGGFMVSNTTANEGTCDIVYSGEPAANENDVPLPANGSFWRYAPNVANLPDGFNSSVTVTCTQPVVGIANLAAEPGSGRYGDSFAQSNGLNQ